MNLRSLFYLDVGHNDMSGTIPVDWVEGQSRMINLKHLYLSNNRFNGQLPSPFSNLANGRIQQIIIHDNQFTGAFPGGYDIIDIMARIEIQNNDFTLLSNDICDLQVWSKGEMVTFKADCKICTCKDFCGQGECY